MKKVLIYDFFGVISSEVGVPWFKSNLPEAEAIGITGFDCLLQN